MPIEKIYAALRIMAYPINPENIKPNKKKVRKNRYFIG